MWESVGRGCGRATPSHARGFASAESGSGSPSSGDLCVHARLYQVACCPQLSLDSASLLHLPLLDPAAPPLPSAFSTREAGEKEEADCEAIAVDSMKVAEPSARAMRK
ncbi:hypothetical protein RJ55_00410 [Drechmeria coniospora]|nr:hypothetical protein RJ55_00410 [Drechmeria coniospora]